MPWKTTQWGLIDALKSGDAERRNEAMGEIISLYGAPLFAFAMRETKGTRSAQDCEDFVNNFFLECIEGEVLERADPARGRFRNFLARSFKNCLLNEIRNEHTKKRAPKGGFVSLQALTEDHGPALEPRSNETPEDAYHRVLRRSLFYRVLCEFRSRCVTAGQEKKYRLFLLRDVNPKRDGGPVPTYSALAAELKLSSENAANGIVLAARAEFRTLLLAEVSKDCATQEEAQVECKLVLNTAFQE